MLAYLSKLRMPGIVSLLKYFWQRTRKAIYYLSYREKSTQLSNSEHHVLWSRGNVTKGGAWFCSSIWDVPIILKGLIRKKPFSSIIFNVYVIFKHANHYYIYKEYSLSLILNAKLDSNSNFCWLCNSIKKLLIHYYWTSSYLLLYRI